MRWPGADARSGRGQHLGEPQSIVTTGMGDGDCGYGFEVGRRYVIHAFAKSSDGGLGTHMCSMTGPFEEAAELLTYVDTLSKPSPGGRVSGIVRLSSAAQMWGADSDPPVPLSGARVVINGPVARSVTTGADGAFAFEAVPPGPYQLTVSTDDRREIAMHAPEEFVLRSRSRTSSGAMPSAIFRPGDTSSASTSHSGRNRRVRMP